MSVQKIVKVRQKIFRGEVDVILLNINNDIPIDAAVVIEKCVFVKNFDERVKILCFLGR